MKWLCIGIDPDSKRLTATISDQEDNWVVMRKVLPQTVSNARRLAVAYAWVCRMVKERIKDGYEVHVFIESPFVSPKFVNAVIPLARLNGAMLAGASAGGAHTIHETTISSWKKGAIGSGGASKQQIEAWCRRDWPNLWKYGQDFTKAEGRQDIYDSAGINRYGRQIVQRMQHRSEFYAEHPEEIELSPKMRRAMKAKPLNKKR